VVLVAVVVLPVLHFQPYHHLAIFHFLLFCQTVAMMTLNEYSASQTKISSMGMVLTLKVQQQALDSSLDVKVYLACLLW
jgi:hypothetical protein